MRESFLQERWGGYMIVSRERKHARTIACGSAAACWAALELVRDAPLTWKHAPINVEGCAAAMAGGEP